MLSFAGFTAVRRHYSLILRLIILFVLLLLSVLLLPCPLYYTLTNNNNTNNTYTSGMLRNGGFQTQTRTRICNKLCENPNSQQEESPQPPQHSNHRGTVVGSFDVGGQLVDHKNLAKSRIADVGSGKATKFTTKGHNCCDGNERTEAAYNRFGEQVDSGAYNRSNINYEYIRFTKLFKSRSKRTIIFNGGGIVKFVMGVSFPVSLADKQRSLSHVYNLQCQYPPPMRPIYWWNYFDSSIFAARQRNSRHMASDKKLKLHRRLRHDVSREFIYAAIEQIYERYGIPGESCLLQAICEVSQTPFHVPRTWENKLEHLWHALVNAVLIPTVPNVAMKYLHASQAGRFGVDCQQTFSECPPRVNAWLRHVADTL